MALQRGKSGINVLASLFLPSSLLLVGTDWRPEGRESMYVVYTGSLRVWRRGPSESAQHTQALTELALTPARLHLIRLLRMIPMRYPAQEVICVWHCAVRQSKVRLSQ